jgi:PqqD family protein of HPr-rel-A system
VASPRWRLPSGQRLLFEDFDDGTVMFDATVGATHLLTPTAAEALAIIQDRPGLSTAELHAELLARLELGADVLPAAALTELLRRLEDLQLVSGAPA